MAKLHDTAGDNLLLIDGDSVTLFEDSADLEGLYEAIAFETVKAYSTGGNDRIEGDSAVDFLMLQGDWEV